MTLKDNFLKKEILLHVLFWVIVFFIPYFKSISSPLEYDFNLQKQLSDILFGALVFYSAYFYFFKQKFNVVSLLSFISFLLFIGFLNFKTNNWFFERAFNDSYFQHASTFFSVYLLFTLFAFAIYSIKNSYYRQLELDNLKLEKQSAQLSGLKSQINPHFLFNTLNMIYSSAIKKEDKTADLVLKLSDNFRYLLQEGQNDYVTIDKEITHLRSYITLQEERLSKKVKVALEIDIDNDSQMIAPLLLLPFIENAFKYSSLLKGKGHFISIKISVVKSTLVFRCENSYDHSIKEDMDLEWQQSGIGISNTKMRLNILYPGKHKLDIDETNRTFNVSLTIDL